MKNIGYSPSVGLRGIEVLNMKRVAVDRKQESFFTQIVFSVDCEPYDFYTVAEAMQSENDAGEL